MPTRIPSGLNSAEHPFHLPKMVQGPRAQSFADRGEHLPTHIPSKITMKTKNQDSHLASRISSNQILCSSRSDAKVHASAMCSSRGWTPYDMGRLPHTCDMGKKGVRHILAWPWGHAWAGMIPRSITTRENG